jgi:hypothetical protein
MRRQVYRDLVIRIGPVWVMIHSVGRHRNPLHEPECLLEILEFEHSVQIAFHDAQPSSLPNPAATSWLDSLFPLVCALHRLPARSVSMGGQIHNR